MSEVIIFPDAEALLIDLFADELPGFGYSIPVASRVPNPRPSTFVRVMRAGGVSRDRVIDVPTVAVEAWAPTETAAIALASTLRGILHAAESSRGIYSVGEFAGPANLPDPATSQIRYTATYSVGVRGTAA